jgi:O-succinylbenzoic acid--CoA ligase
VRDWLSHRVASSPDEPALVRASDGEAWTYTDLDRLVSETAGRLVAHGIEPGDRLGVITPPYVGTVGLVHAAMRVGATFVPLGQDLTPRELSGRIEVADLSAVICADPTEDEALAAVDGRDDTPVFSVDEPDDPDVTAVHCVEPAPVDEPAWAFDDFLCILFTSGTTGDPKPVPLTAGNVYSSAVASAFRLGVDPGDRWLVSLSLHHMGGLAPVYRSALYGTTLVLREGFDPGGTADDIDTYDVTGVSLVPTMLKRMLDMRGTLADSLRVVLLGGAPAPDDLLERCRAYSIPVYPTYGMTESASQIATSTPSQTRKRLGTVGRPLFGTDVTVVDEDGSPVDAGTAGEIVVDGPTVTPGYLESPADGGRAAAELDRSEFGPHGLHTGDVGRFDEDGYLYVLNRLDDRIISGGENVEPGEVTDVLRAFEPIEAASVVGLDDDRWGERVSALLAIGDREAESVDEAALKSFARERLSGFKIPKTVAFTDELPRTVSGTVDRGAVREALRERGHPLAGDSQPELETAGFEAAEPSEADDDATAATERAADDRVEIADAEAVANEADAKAIPSGDEAPAIPSGDDAKAIPSREDAPAAPSEADTSEESEEGPDETTGESVAASEEEEPETAANDGDENESDDETEDEQAADGGTGANHEAETDGETGADHEAETDGENGAGADGQRETVTDEIVEAEPPRTEE